MWESGKDDWRLFMRGFTNENMESRIKNLMTEEKENDIIRKNDVGRGKNQIEYYRKIEEKINFKPVTEEQFEQLTIPLKKMGVTIMRGDEETERRLKLFNAQGSTLGKDIVAFRQQVSISTILEETHHIRQNRNELNNDKEQKLRTILNEIDAKKYLIKIANKYNIPHSETEETKRHLAYYEKALSDYFNEKGE